MPTFEVTAPDGKKLEINGPEGGTQEQALAYAKANYKPEPAKEPGIGERIGQVGRGLAEGFAGGVEFVKEGLTPRIGGMDIGAMQKAEARDVGLVEKVTGSLPEPGPKDTMGRYLRTAGQFLGNPLSYVGPGGAAIKGASAVTGAIGAQTAHEAGLGPIGEAVGAVVGGGIPRTGARTAPHPQVAPTVDELNVEATRLYEHPEVRRLIITPEASGGAADTIQNVLLKKGARPRGAPETYDIVNELRRENPLTIGDFQDIRFALGEVAQDVNAMGRATRDARAATLSIQELDKWLGKIEQNQLVQGDAQVAAPMLAEARGNYAAAMRADRLENAEERAERQAAASHSGTNLANNLRQKANQILNSPTQRRGLDENELKQLDQIVRGTFVGNVSRRLSKIFGEAGLMGFLGGAAGFAAGGPIGAPVLPAIGMTARKISETSTQRQVGKLGETIRSRSPLAEKSPKQPNAVLKYIESLPPEWQQALRSLGTQTTRP